MRTHPLLRRALATAVVCLGLTPAAARAEAPSGTYLLALDAEDALPLFRGTVTATRGNLVSSTDVDTDAQGSVTGTANLKFTGMAAMELDLALQGSLAGTVTKPKAKLAVTATGTLTVGAQELDVVGAGKMKCRGVAEDQVILPCEGKLRVCFELAGQTLDCRGLPFFAYVSLARTPVDVALELATDARHAVSGTASVVVQGEAPLAGAARGKHSTRADASSLRVEGDPPAGATRLAFTKAAFAEGGPVSGTLRFRIAGLKGRADLANLALPAPEPVP